MSLSHILHLCSSLSFNLRRFNLLTDGSQVLDAEMYVIAMCCLKCVPMALRIMAHGNTKAKN